MRPLLRTYCLLGLILAGLPSLTSAQPPDADFDNMLPGPWPGEIVVGAGPCAEIVPVSNGTTGGAPLPPDAEGNMLCIDTREKTSNFGVRINYDCAPGDPEGICQIRYGFSGAAWMIGAGYEVHVDDEDGNYDTPDDQWEPPVGIPPSTTRGSDTDNADGCTINHTLDIIVRPGTVVYFDGFTIDCIDPTPIEQGSWSIFKSMFESGERTP